MDESEVLDFVNGAVHVLPFTAAASSVDVGPSPEPRPRGRGAAPEYPSGFV
ncbi:MAG: hypothetical protein ACYTBJ_18365 [Planctomycetota bacterium]